VKYHFIPHGVLAFGLTCVALAPLRAQEAPKLSSENFDQLRQAIQPKEGEDKWKAIPWMANLWEARRRAAAEGKPILLWEMDGNPLGCV